MSQPKNCPENYPYEFEFTNYGNGFHPLPYEIPFEYKQIVYPNGSGGCRYPGFETDWVLFNEFAEDVCESPSGIEKYEEFRDIAAEAIHEFINGGALADIIADAAREKFELFKLEKKAEWHPPLIYPTHY